jgi:Ca2+-transporting ATPase
MNTGDHADTASAIAGQLGIRGRAITGAEFGAMSDEQAVQAIDDIGVIARVAPEHKVRLVDILRSKGHIVAMTGDGVNDAPALKRADIGVAMGITGTEVSKEAAVMILTDDNFATIVKAVELGRALYDNLMRYIRFQMACLFGFIGTFLGASIFNILGGVPFLPIQTLWINFTTDVFQAIGLGYGKPREGLMEESPRPKDKPILPRPLFLWLAAIGLWMAAWTLGVIVWSGNAYDEPTAHTMGLVTFSLFHLFYSLEASNAERTLFSSELIENPILLRASLLSALTIFLATTFGPLQRLLDTVELSPELWAVCLLAASTIIVVEEVRKIFRRRSSAAEAPATAVPVLTGQAS